LTGIKQTERLIQITTPLGEDTFVVLSFAGTEEISGLFAFELELASKRSDIGFSELAGKNVTVSIRAGNGDMRFFNGIIAEFSPIRISEEEDYGIYYAVMLPALWSLKQCYDCRIFQDKTVPDILKEVLSSLGAKEVRQSIDHRMALTGTYPARRFCVQYNETDFDFIARLCEDEGIFYFFEHEKGKHTLVFADNPDADKKIAIDPVKFQRTTGSVLEGEVIRELEQTNRLATAKFTARDFNFKIPYNDLTVNQEALLAPDFNVGERYEYPGGYPKTADEGKRIAMIRIQERDAQVQTLRGRGNCRHFIPGFRFTLDDYPLGALNGKGYLLTEVRHEAKQGLDSGESGGDSYENRFSCIPHKIPYRPARKTARPLITGVQPAIVTGPKGEEIHTDDYGRVKVHFPWDRRTDVKGDGNMSCWIRVSQGWAGGGWGAMHIPRVGQEVLVNFIEGDPDRPVITGRVYNAANMPPYPLPAEKTKSTIISSSSPGNNGDNELRFEDKAGQEEVYLHGQKDWNILIENDKGQKVGHDETMNVVRNRTKTVGVDQKETIGQNKTIQVGQNHSESIGQNKTLQVGENHSESIGGNQTVTVKSAASESITLGKALNVGAGYAINVGGAMNTLVGLSNTEEVGVSKILFAGVSISIKSNGTVKIEGKDIEIAAENSVKITGKVVDIN